MVETETTLMTLNLSRHRHLARWSAVNAFRFLVLVCFMDDLIIIVKSERVTLVLAHIEQFQILEVLCTRELCGAWGTGPGAHRTTNNTMDFENVRVGPYSSCHGPTLRI